MGNQRGKQGRRMEENELIKIGMGKDPLNPLLNLVYCKKERLLGRIVARHPKNDYAIWVSLEDSKGKFYSVNEKKHFAVKRGEKFLIMSADENHYPIIMERWQRKALYDMESIIPGVYHGKGNPVCSVCHGMPEPTPENTPCPISHIVLRGKKYEKKKWEGYGKWDFAKDDDASSCGDCAAPIGSPHHKGCDLEDCPRCGQQFIGCGCIMTEKAHQKMLHDLTFENSDWEKGRIYRIFKDPKLNKRYDIRQDEGHVLLTGQTKKSIIKFCKVKKEIGAFVLYEKTKKNCLQVMEKEKGKIKRLEK